MERSIDIEGKIIKIIQYNKSYEELLRQYPSANTEMDDYVVECAVKDKFEGKSITFLFLNEEQNYLYGYYSLFATSVINPRDESGEMVGTSAVEVKLFAINEQLSGKICESFTDEEREYTISDILLMYVMGQVKTYSEEFMGISALVLKSTRKALNFYKRNNFVEIEKLMLPYDKMADQCVEMMYGFSRQS